MRSALIVPSLLAALLLAGCPKKQESAPDAGPHECDTRADCSAKGDAYKGKLCSANFECTGCDSDGQCELRELCEPEKRVCVFRPGWGDTCRLNADCDAGKLCVQGLCIPEKDAVLCVADHCLADGQRCNRTNQVCEENIGCLVDLDCAPAELCNVPTHTCMLRCTPENQGQICAAGQKCVDSRCADCADSTDCPGGLVCDPGKLTCVADGSARCLSGRDCQVPLICNPATGFCTDKPPPCLTDEDCLRDERCDIAAGKCVKRACQPDRFEPNHDQATAKPLTAGSYPGLTLCDRVQDWFSLTLSRGDLLDVFVDADPLLEPVVTTRLLDPTGRIVGVGNLALDRMASRDGTFYLRMESTDPYVDYGLRLSISKGTPCGDDRFEPNDTPASATAVRDQGELNQLTLCGADVDYFLVDVPTGQGVSVELHYVPTEGDADLQLLTANGATVLGTSATTDPVETVQLTAGQIVGGQVLVKVSSADWRAHDSYYLRIAYVP